MAAGIEVPIGTKTKPADSVVRAAEAVLRIVRTAARKIVWKCIVRF
jgi:hypothetical protein